MGIVDRGCQPPPTSPQEGPPLLKGSWMGDGSVHFHVKPLLLIGRTQTFPLITETGKKHGC